MQMELIQLNISSLTDLRFVFYGNLFNGSIDNVSVREVGQDWTLGDWVEYWRG